jgi:glycosyltransferase involved in cell wall biosynthesis
MIEFGYPRQKISVLNNAYFQPVYDGCADARSYILYVGRLVEHKGVDVLIRAVADLAIPVLIVGDGPERPKLEALSKRLNAKSVEFLGFQPMAEANKLYAGAMLAVIPSRWYENGPLVILEAYAHGTPVVGADIGAIPEFIEEGKTGYLFETNNPHSLRQVLRRALSDPDELRRMGEIAHRLVRERYSPELYAQKLESILESVL